MSTFTPPSFAKSFTFTCHLRASVGARVCLAWVLSWQMTMVKTINSQHVFRPILSGTTAPGFRRLKNTRATMSTFNNQASQAPKTRTAQAAKERRERIIDPPHFPTCPMPLS